MTRETHRVVAISFALGVVDCTCGEVIGNSADELAGVPARFGVTSTGTSEALRIAFAAHRSAFGFTSSHGPGDDFVTGDRSYGTALGNSKLSPRERGLMGAEAKRAKVARA